MKIELYHDILAREIYDLASAEEKMRLKVERLVRERYAFHRERGGLLSREDLDFVLPYLGDLDLNPKQRKFVADSRRALSRAAVRRRVYVAGVIVIVGLLGVAIWQWNQARRNAGEALEQAALAQTEQFKADRARTEAEMQRRRAEVALDTAEYFRQEAEAEAQAARFAELEAQASRIKAEDSEKIAQHQRTANRLTAEALDIRQENPTLALQLTHYACELVDYDNELALRVRDEIFRAYRGSFCRKTIYGHTGSIAQLAFSEDNQSILLSGLDEFIAAPEDRFGHFRSWYLDGRPKKVLLDHVTNISAGAFSAKQDYLLTGSPDGKIILWDTTGRALSNFQDSSLISALAFSRNGNYILSGSRKAARLWDRNGSLVVTFGRDLGTVTSVDFSNDDQRLLTVHGDDNVRIWNRDGMLLAKLDGHVSTVEKALFSPDGKVVLTVSRDSSAKLWDVNGNELLKFTEHSAAVNAAAFSPDGNLILTGGDDKTAKLWDRSGRVLRNYIGHMDNICAVAFSRDGKGVLTGDESGIVKWWEVEHPDIPLARDARAVRGPAAYAPDGQFIVSASVSDQALIWSPEGEQLRTLTGHHAAVSATAVSASSSYILTGNKEGEVLLWKKDGRLLNRFKAYNNSVDVVAFSDDEQIFFAGSQLGGATLWNIAGEKLAAVKPSGQDWFTSLAFDTGKKNILAGSTDLRVRMWDRNGRIKYELPDTLSPETVGFAPDKSFFYAVYQGGKTVFWNNDGQLLHAFQTGSTSGDSPFAAISADRLFLLKTDRDHGLVLYDTTGKFLRAYEPYMLGVRSLAFSPDQSAILVGLNYGLALLDLQYRPIHTFQSHTGPVRTLAVAPHGKTIFTGASRGDHSARLWDMDTPGRQLKIFRGHKGGVVAVAYSPDGRFLLTGSADSTAILWDNKTGRLEKQFQLPAAITDLTFSPDSKTVLIGSTDGEARIWESDGTPLYRFAGHEQRITAVAFAPDGQSIFTSSIDGTVRMWDVQTQRIQRVFRHDYPLNDLAISPDAQYLLAASSYAGALLWQLDGQLLKTLPNSQIKPPTVTAVGFSPDSKKLLIVEGYSHTVLRDMNGRILQVIEGEAAGFHPRTGHLILIAGNQSHQVYPNMTALLDKDQYDPLTASKKLAYGIQQLDDFLGAQEFSGWSKGVDLYLRLGNLIAVRQLLHRILRQERQATMLTSELIQLAQYLRRKDSDHPRTGLFKKTFDQVRENLLVRVKAAERNGRSMHQFDLVEIYELYLEGQGQNASTPAYLRQRLQTKMETLGAQEWISAGDRINYVKNKGQSSVDRYIRQFELEIQLIEEAIAKNEEIRSRHTGRLFSNYRTLTYYQLSHKQFSEAIATAIRGESRRKKLDSDNLATKVALILAHLYGDQHELAVSAYRSAQATSTDVDKLHRDILRDLDKLEKDLGEHQTAARLRELIEQE